MKKRTVVLSTAALQDFTSTLEYFKREMAPTLPA